MPQFFVTTPRGFEKVLERELHALGLTKTKPGIAGVGFHSNWAGCYQANMNLVSASRVLYPVLDFPAYEPDQIYFNVLKHDWTKYIHPDQTIAMDSSVRDSIIRDLRIVSLKAKDAVVDQFRSKFGQRPDVNPEAPDLQISLRLVKNICTVSLDTSGGSLHMRGYRSFSSAAPLKENLAAALIKLSEWDEASPFLDPMCGSGTLCIEAGMMALKIPPGLMKKSFGFQNWKTYQAENYDQLLKQTREKILESTDFKIFGFDSDLKAIQGAKINSKNAGVNSITQLAKQDIVELKPPAPHGTLIVNPPYGERMGDEEALVPLYQDLGRVLKNFEGWKIFLLTSSSKLAEETGFKPRKRHRVFNGAIECHFLEFKV